MLALSKMESGAARYWVTVRNKPRFRVTVEEVNEDWIVIRHFGGGDRVVTQGAEPAAGSGPAASPGPVPEVAADEVAEAGPVADVPRESADSKLFRLMAAGKRAREAEMGRGEPGPAVVDEPGAGTEEAAEEPGPGYAVPPDGFDGLSAYEQKKWVERNWGDLEAKHGELAEEAKNERLAECRVRAGRRKL